MWGGVLRGNSQKYTRPNVSELNLALQDDFRVGLQSVVVKMRSRFVVREV